jgi:hypothetical protein
MQRTVVHLGILKSALLFGDLPGKASGLRTTARRMDEDAVGAPAHFIISLLT